MDQNSFFLFNAFLNEFEDRLKVLRYVLLPMVSDGYVKIFKIFWMIDFEFFACHHNPFDTEVNQKCFVVGHILIANINIIDNFLDV